MFFHEESRPPGHIELSEYLTQAAAFGWGLESILCVGRHVGSVRAVVSEGPTSTAEALEDSTASWVLDASVARPQKSRKKKIFCFWFKIAASIQGLAGTKVSQTEQAPHLKFIEKSVYANEHIRHCAEVN